MTDCVVHTIARALSVFLWVLTNALVLAAPVAPLAICILYTYEMFGIGWMFVYIFLL